MSLDSQVVDELRALAESDRLREVTQYQEGSDRTHFEGSGNRDLLSFCSNDYLGLSTHPAIKQAAACAATTHGVGAGSSRLISGSSPIHRNLETRLAAFLGVEDVLTFPTGYQTNLGVISALAGPQDFIASDAANHASLIDGCRLSRAKVGIYPHCESESVARMLSEVPGARRRFIVTESLFSMDGDRAPLAEIAQIATRFDAQMIVDEAHAFGVLGHRGRGLWPPSLAAPAVRIGTLGKAFGTLGGFAATSRAVHDILVNRARTFIYTTAAPPLLSAATLAALDVIDSAEGDVLRSALHRNVTQLTSGIPSLNKFQDHIVPLRVGSDAAASSLSQHLQAQGLLVPAIRPPTVPENTARLRITLSALHTPVDIAGLLASLHQANLDPQPPRGDTPSVARQHTPNPQQNPSEPLRRA